MSDTNSILLCIKLFVSPLEDPRSIAKKHDYGIKYFLLEVSKSSQNYISLMRLFGFAAHIKNKSSGYCMSFALDGTYVCARNILSEIDHNHSPQVTFIRTKDQW